jgi:oligopeptide/dipeptide ABC transporter ATP-binding protein
LISAVPAPGPDKPSNRKRIVLTGDIPSVANPPAGCRFHARCPYPIAECSRVQPILRELTSGHWSACIRIGPDEPNVDRALRRASKFSRCEEESKSPRGALPCATEKRTGGSVVPFIQEIGRGVLHECPRTFGHNMLSNLHFRPFYSSVRSDHLQSRRLETKAHAQRLWPHYDSKRGHIVRKVTQQQHVVPSFQLFRRNALPLGQTAPHGVSVRLDY